MVLELTPLRQFLVVAEELSISRAAARLHLSQPALSRQIARLEADLGVSVFLRSTRGVRLTPAGEALVLQARHTLAQAEHAVAVTRRAAARAGAPVRVGFYCDTAAVMLPELVVRHRRAWPDATVDVEQLDFRTQLRRLRDGALDVAFVRPFCTLDDLRRETLRAEPVAVALPLDHPLAGASLVPLEALAGEPWIVMANSVVGADFHTRTVGRLRAAGVEGEITTTTSLQAGVGLAAAGLGVFACPLSTRETVPETVALVPIEGWTTGVEMVWLRDAVPLTVRRFLQVARSAGASGTSRVRVAGGAAPLSAR